MTMPNKNSIESEIEDWFNSRDIDISCSDIWCASNQHDYCTEYAKTELKNLIQREVKKGRVEELEKLNQNLIKSGVEEKAEERIMLVIDDRLEELEG